MTRLIELRPERSWGGIPRRPLYYERHVYVYDLVATAGAGSKG